MKSQFLKFFVFSFILSISIKMHAQNNYLLGMGDYINYANINRTNSPANLPYEDIKGSPYLFGEFETGRINLKDGKIYEGPLRYDMYANQFDFKTKEGEVFSVINPETIEKISIDKRLFVYVINNEKPNTGSYYEVLVDGEFSLLAKHWVILKDPVPAKPYIEAKPATFVAKEDIYYIQNENSGMVEIKNKDVLTGIDSNRTDEIKAYIKENKIKTSSKSDLIEVVNFLNTK
jgi:hypothetical protein